MNRSRAALVAAGSLLACAAGYAAGCSATSGGSSLNEGGSGAAIPVGGGGHSSGGGGHTSTAGSGGINLNTGGDGGQGGVIVDPCASECGDEELCDGIHAGIDDDCDYQVDENCPCSTGMVQSCFKGEPAWRSEDGCFPGTQHCSEFGFWAECVGGVHATPEDQCYSAQVGCHAITGYPFVPVNLKDGTGDFSQDAIAGTESWTVDCPAGIDPCPAVTGTNPPDDFTALQSGEYTVHYFKTTANGDDSCDYPLLIGAPGLRVELQWEHGVDGPTDYGVDLDLHVHKPQDYAPWQADGGNAVDCAWNNCTALDFWMGGGPDWFNGVAPPDPVDWYLDPVPERNTCYYGPAGSGADWQMIGQGCHNPRLDLDNISCDPTEQDVNASDFCAPENINIDYPPANEWIRIGVHYYSSGETYDVHPTVRIFCHGKLAAELGPQGFYDPNQPVTFTPAMGTGGDERTFWMVADVKFLDDPCLDDLCTVEPIYYDPNDLSPLLTTVGLAKTSVGPSYPQ